MQLNTSYSGFHRSKARLADPSQPNRPISEKERNEALTQRALKNDKVSQPPLAITADPLDRSGRSKPVFAAGQVDHLSFRSVYRILDFGHYPSLTKHALNTYRNVEVARVPEKVELLGIDIFV